MREGKPSSRLRTWLVHATHDFHTPPKTCLHHPRLVYTTPDLFTPPTTCLHHPRIVYTTHELFTPPTNCLHHPRLVYITHNLFTPPTTCLHHARHTHTHAYMACRHLTGRESTRNCLEIDGSDVLGSVAMRGVTLATTLLPILP